MPGTRSLGGTTATLKERYAIPPETIRALPTGRAVVITKVPHVRAELTHIDPPATGASRAPTHDAQARTHDATR